MQTNVPLSSLTTLEVGGPAREYVEAYSDAEVIEAVHESDLASVPVLVLGGGSNLLVGDGGFDGRVVKLMATGAGFDVVDDGDLASVTVQAGRDWDDAVELSLQEGLSGWECLSGIPGSTGATPVQNVGAYGVEISSSFVSLRAYDREKNTTVYMGPDECAFGYRTSAFKRRHRYVILSVEFELAKSDLSVPVEYSELARTLGVEAGERAPATEVREAVLSLRRKKGMVLDPDDPDTRSAGSFFTNPVLGKSEFDALFDGVETPPHWPSPDGTVKVSAAWLIQNAGFERGHTLGRVRLSTKHTLALTNFDGGTADELLALAKMVQAGVRSRFGVSLHAEPVLVGAELD